MGGSGSGRWNAVSIKQTVEDALTLSINELQKKHFLDQRSGTVTWFVNDTQTASINYNIENQSEKSGSKVLVLRYSVNGKPIKFSIQVVGSPQKFGGIRFRFVCPLIRDGVKCQRRSEKLYLPHGSHYFGCRHCYNLTYRSSQESHVFDNLCKDIAGSINAPFDLVKSILKPRKD